MGRDFWRNYWRETVKVVWGSCLRWSICSRKGRSMSERWEQSHLRWNADKVSCPLAPKSLDPTEISNTFYLLKKTPTLSYLTFPLLITHKLQWLFDFNKEITHIFFTHRPWAPDETLLQQRGKSTEQLELVMFIWMEASRFASEHKYFPRSCKENSFHRR